MQQITRHEKNGKCNLLRLYVETREAIVFLNPWYMKHKATVNSAVTGKSDPLMACIPFPISPTGSRTPDRKEVPSSTAAVVTVRRATRDTNNVTISSANVTENTTFPLEIPKHLTALQGQKMESTFLTKAPRHPKGHCFLKFPGFARLSFC